MEERFIRNYPAVTEAQQLLLGTKHVAVAGAGGIGGYVVEYLVRIGIGEITVIDGDSFCLSNMNRQLLCTEHTLGRYKAGAAATRAGEIDPAVRIRAVEQYLTEENAADLLSGADLVIDALDSIRSRMILEDGAAANRQTIIHGAVEGWDLQIMEVPPGEGILHALYGNGSIPEEKEHTILAMVPAVAAGLEVSAALQKLLGYTGPVDRKLFSMSLMTFGSCLEPVHD